MTIYRLSTANISDKDRLEHFAFHVLPGMIILANGLWLVLNVLKHHYLSALTNGQQPFRSQQWYPGPFTKRIPLESAIRSGLCLFSSVVSTWNCCWGNQNIPPENTHHAIMLFSMFLSGLLEVTASRRSGGSLTSVLPPGTDRASSLLTAVVGFFVFAFHFHNEVPLQTHFHSFLAWFIGMLVVAHVAEMLGRDQVWMALLRPYVLFVTGQWMCQIGFSLYFPVIWPRTWEDSSMPSIATVNFLVCSHLVITFMLFMVIAMLVRHCVIVGHYKSESNGKEHHKLLRDV